MAEPSYPFRLVRHEETTPPLDLAVLAGRPFLHFKGSFADEARLFEPGKALETAINASIAVGDPLLITGEPGTGKTQTAYYAAWKLGLEPVLHFQVKSDSTARDLLYHFDTVRYFHDAHLARDGTKLDKKDYREPRPLWEAFASEHPRVLLIDEIDKASRDFPNDLLHELDQMAFQVVETGEEITAPPARRPLVFLTSNSERRLPEPFLRRCVYHHIRFDQDLIERAMERRREQFGALSDDFVKLAVERFLALRDQPLRKKPSTAELLVWLRVLAAAAGTFAQPLEENLARLPFLGTLLKDHRDLEDLA